MTDKLLALAAAAVLCLAGHPRAGEDVKGVPDPSESVIVVRKCPIEYDKTTLLASPVASVLQDRMVRRGDRVKAGQVLGRLYDQDIRADMEQMALEAQSDIHVRINKSTYLLAVNKLQTTGALSKRNFASAEEYQAHQHEVEKARLAIEEAEHQRKLAQVKLRKAEAQVHALELVSPHDGVVAEVYKSQGESVGLKDPVFRVVNTDLLRIEGALNVTDAWRAKEGQKVRVYPEVGGAVLDVERQVFVGHVVFVGNEIDPESQTCRVFAEVNNRNNMLKSGLTARMEIITTEEVAVAPRPVNQVTNKPSGDKPADEKVVTRPSSAVTTPHDGAR